MKENAITETFISAFKVEWEQVKSVDYLVSFIQTSGFELLKPVLLSIKTRKIPIRIVTSTYMNITDPMALAELHHLFGQGVVHLYNGSAPSFHPKAYMFHYMNQEKSFLYVGSSNVSKVAMTNGLEWNYKVEKSLDEEAFDLYTRTFDRIYEQESYEMTKEDIRMYRKNYVLPGNLREKSRMNQYYNSKQRRMKNLNKETETEGKIENTKQLQDELAVYNKSEQILYEPKEAQREALIELEETRQEGNKKALVVAATGIGKTFLAAFDSRISKRILFIAHREEILNQAYETFGKIRGYKNCGRFFGHYKELDKDILMASIQTMKRETNLLKFDPQTFDYIIIDEIHHGTSTSYQRVLNYFDPKFLLGLTATPERLDKNNVYALCDYNLVYEVDLVMGINRGWLVPFDYYAIGDVTVDYGKITYLNGKYKEDELEVALSINQRAELILKHYKDHRGKCALAFCISIEHAEFMAGYFKEQKIDCGCIHSDATRKHYVDREEGLLQLQNGKLDIIFSVDMLNEGVDIPSLDLLLFLRPTESPIVFFQQLGRGLRTCEGKRLVTILDFIGNHKKVGQVPKLFDFSIERAGKSKIEDFKKHVNDLDNLPLGCKVNFDFESLNLIEKVIQSKLSKRQQMIEQIREWYECCKEEHKEEIGKKMGNVTLEDAIPNRMCFFNWLSKDNYELVRSANKDNPFKDYSAYIKEDLIEEELVNEDFYKSDDYRFLTFIEGTGMDRMYKLPVFLTFIKDNHMVSAVSKESLIDSFRCFYDNKRNKKDLQSGAGKRKKRLEVESYTDKKWWRLIKEKPIYYLCKKNPDIFTFDEEKNEFKIKLEFVWFKEDQDRENWFLNQIKDAIEFRRGDFLRMRLGD